MGREGRAKTEGRGGGRKEGREEEKAAKKSWVQNQGKGREWKWGGMCGG